ncbi:MAG: A24 family peptidase [Candidatus Acidiferrales bacterium]
MAERGIWIAALTMVCGAGIWDWRERRIPNVLTVAGLLTGIALNAWWERWPGVLNSLEGAGLALGLLLPMVLLRGLGAGDWKLMGALGALVGPAEVMAILLATIFLSGIVALGQVLVKRRMWETFLNLWDLVRGFFVYGLLPHPQIHLENPRGVSLPFGVVAAVATLVCFWLGRPRW